MPFFEQRPGPHGSGLTEAMPQRRIAEETNQHFSKRRRISAVEQQPRRPIDDDLFRRAQRHTRLALAHRFEKREPEPFAAARHDVRPARLVQASQLRVRH